MLKPEAAVLHFALLLWACSLMVACSTTPEPLPPSVLKLEIKADSVINFDASEKAAPLQVRMYELKSQGIFLHADFLELLHPIVRNQKNTLILRVNGNRLSFSPTMNVSSSELLNEVGCGQSL